MGCWGDRANPRLGRPWRPGGPSSAWCWAGARGRGPSSPQPPSAAASGALRARAAAVTVPEECRGRRPVGPFPADRLPGKEGALVSGDPVPRAGGAFWVMGRVPVTLPEACCFYTRRPSACATGWRGTGSRPGTCKRCLAGREARVKGARGTQEGLPVTVTRRRLRTRGTKLLPRWGGAPAPPGFRAVPSDQGSQPFLAHGAAAALKPADPSQKNGFTCIAQNTKGINTKIQGPDY